MLALVAEYHRIAGLRIIGGAQLPCPVRPAVVGEGIAPPGETTDLGTRCLPYPIGEVRAPRLRRRPRHAASTLTTTEVSGVRIAARARWSLAHSGGSLILTLGDRHDLGGQ